MQDTILYGDRFLADHAGPIVSSPRLAITELVANAYDAGATRVDITWPEHHGDRFMIADNGVGMTSDQFLERWRTLNYNRISSQGSRVVFPSDVPNPPTRTAFGRNGKGRFASFCFAPAYLVYTKAEGAAPFIALVKTLKKRESPYRVTTPRRAKDQFPHGTQIMGLLRGFIMKPVEVRLAVGSKFLVDPAFTVTLNGEALELLNLKTTRKQTLFADDLRLTVVEVDPGKHDRTTNLRGITWWVNRRMVGQPNWDGLDQAGSILDGRRKEAKRFSFVVFADGLADHVNESWSQFRDHEAVREAKRVVREHVVQTIEQQLRKGNKAVKIDTLRIIRERLVKLPRNRQNAVGEFLDTILQRCPSIKPNHLTAAASAFAKMESAQSKYDLLEKLSALAPDDVDRLREILAKWSVRDVETVMEELDRRIALLKKLRSVTREKSDELHVIHPLIAQGLWIFGPEFESPHYGSNRSILTILSKMLGGNNGSVSPQSLRVRPDLVALPRAEPLDFIDTDTGTFSAHTTDRMGADCEVDGLDKVLIVELKKSDPTGRPFRAYNVIGQGMEYANTIKSAGINAKDARFFVFSLASQFENDAADPTTSGSISAVAMCYDTLIRRADARTFRLQQRLSEHFGTPSPSDAEVAQVMADADSTAA